MSDLVTISEFSYQLRLCKVSGDVTHHDISALVITLFDKLYILVVNYLFLTREAV